MISRRQFLAGAAAATAAAAAAPAGAKPPAPAPSASPALPPAPAARQPSPPGRLIVSEPVLQNAAETSMGVAFAVSADASGWVEYSASPDFSGAVRAYSGCAGLMDVNPRVAQVRLRNLRPCTKYWYRIGADRIRYGGGYNMKNLGAERGGGIHSFMTLGPGYGGTFCVINDTHERKDAIGLELAKIAGIKPRVVVWNGDASNTSEDIDTALGIFMHTHPDHPAYAADTPYMFINGNHDFRGRFNRRLHEVMMLREPAERRGEYAELGRNFVQRLGDVALIGMDTGEDKVDTNPKFAGIFRMGEYRELQTRWLAEAIDSPAVKTAKKKVVFCHIPLFDPRPGENPGDITPADRDPRYRTDYASWQRTCANMWSPLFAKAGVQLVIAAHQHCFRYDPPAKGRPWAQIVGGGCDVRRGDMKRFPTVIEGRCEGERLKVAVHDVANGRVVFGKEF